MWKGWSIMSHTGGPQLKRPLEEEVGAKQICEKETSLVSQFFKTFTLDLEIVLKNWEIVLKGWEILFKVAHYDL